MSETKLTDEFDRRTRDIKQRGFVCASCELADRLHSDSHGTFCQRCGPSYSLKLPAGREALRTLTEGQPHDRA